MLKDTIKKILPEPVIESARHAFDALKRCKDIPDAYFSPERLNTIRRLGALQNIHKGERCFIIGNGPSLNQTDLTKLKNEYTFGLNRIYLAFPKMGFETTYYLCVNDLVAEQTHDDIEKLTMPRFVSLRHKKWVRPAPDLYYLYGTYTGPTFAKDIRKRMWEGATVT